MKSARILPLCLSALAVLISLIGVGSPGQVPDPLEAAFQLRAEGFYEESLSRLLSLLEGTLGPENKATPEARLAETEFLLAVIKDLTGFNGAYSRTLETLDRMIPLLQEADPHLLSLIRQNRLFCLTALPGRMDEALEVTRALGYVGVWAVSGPFDNERGGGFKKKYGPEKEFDFAGRYPGKVREVGWRTVDGSRAVGGIINLNNLLRPSNQVLAYAVTAVHMPVPGSVALHLGSDEAVVVWVNGREVLRRDVRRPFRPDQDVIGLELPAGHHRILLKVCDQDGPWKFSLRLTRLDGGPLESVRCSADGEEIVRAGTAGPPESVPIVWDSAAYLKRLAENGDAVAAFKLAFLLLDRRQHDAKARAPYRWARRAAAGLKDFAYARYLAARALSLGSQDRDEKDENLRRQALEQAVSMNVRFAEAYLDLASYHIRMTDNRTQAEVLVKKALAINDAYAPALVYRAWLLDRRGWPLEYRLALDAVVRSRKGGKFPDALVRLARIESARGNLERAADLAGRALALGQHAAARRIRVRALLGLGKKKEAEALLRTSLEGRPFSLSARGSLADFYKAVGRLDDAARMVEEALGIAPEDPELHLRLARLDGLRGFDDRMRSRMRQALVLDPKLSKVERHLRFLEATEEPFYSGLAMDADAALKADRKPPAEAVELSASHYYLFRHLVVHVNPDGTRSDYGHFIARILTEAGTRKFARFSVPYSSHDQRGRILEANVVRADGRVERGTILNPSVRSWYGYARVTFPALSVGDAVEVSWRRDDLSQSIFGDYFGLVHLFQAPDLAAVKLSRLDLILPEDRAFFFQAKNGAPEPEMKKQPDGKILRTCRMRHLKTLRVESRQPDAEELAPLIRVTTYRDWNDLAAWWWNLIREQMRSDEAIKTMVKELIQGKTSTADKIRALYDFVVTDINYTAWEFGVHGYKPYEAGAIFARRFGDCKDKAILLCTMLGEIGVKAYPAIIHADVPRSHDDLALPMVEHFNHCIAFLPAAGDDSGTSGIFSTSGIFMDGTAAFHPLGVLPDMDRGARVLVVEDGKARLRDVSWGSPEEHDDRIEYDVFLKADNSAEIHITMTPVGSPAVSVRDRFASEVGQRRKRFEDRFARLFGKVTIEDMRFSDLGDLSVPVRIEVVLAVESFLKSEEGNLFLKVAFQPHSLSRLVAARSRRHDMVLGPPSMVSTRIRYRFPPGMKSEPLPPTLQFGGPHGTFRVRLRRTEDGIVVEREVRITAPRVTRSTYPVFQNFVQGLDRAEVQTLQVTMTSGKGVGR